MAPRQASDKTLLVMALCLILLLALGNLAPVIALSRGEEVSLLGKAGLILGGLGLLFSVAAAIVFARALYRRRD